MSREGREKGREKENEQGRNLLVYKVIYKLPGKAADFLADCTTVYRLTKQSVS